MHGIIGFGKRSKEFEKKVDWACKSITKFAVVMKTLDGTAAFSRYSHNIFKKVPKSIDYLKSECIALWNLMSKEVITVKFAETIIHVSLPTYD